MQHTFEVMSTTFLTAGLPAEYAIEVEDWTRQVENKLSRFRPESELSRLNSGSGKPFSVSCQFYEVLSEAFRFYRETQGLFNPFLGKSMVQLGYDRSFENLPRVFGERGECSGIQSQPSDRGAEKIRKPLILYSTGLTVRLAKGIAVDLGGFAKGWSAQKACERLGDRLDRGLIDAGGDVIAWVNDPEGIPWCIGVANPMDPDEDIADLSLAREVGIATSSTVKRRWYNEGGRIAHHILDPHTQLPANTDYIQVTVLAPSLTVAEVYAKCLIILGSEEGPAWIRRKRPGLGYLAVDRNGLVTANQNINKYCVSWEINSDVKFVS